MISIYHKYYAFESYIRSTLLAFAKEPMAKKGDPSNLSSKERVLLQTKFSELERDIRKVLVRVIKLLDEEGLSTTDDLRLPEHQHVFHEYLLIAKPVMKLDEARMDLNEKLIAEDEIVPRLEDLFQFEFPRLRFGQYGSMPHEQCLY